MITFLVSGLWHGASLHFAVWGLLHGAVICAERMLGINAIGRMDSISSTIQRETFASEGATAINKPHQNAPKKNTSDGNNLMKAIMVCMTCIIVCALWIFFRSGSVKDALAIGKRIAYAPVKVLHLCIGLAAAVLLCMADAFKHKRCFASLPRWVRRLLYYAGGMALLCIMLLRTKVSPFVYFQF